MERVRIGKDIVFQWEVRKDGAALTAEDAANLTLEIAGRNGKSQRLPFEIRDSKIIAAWYGVRQTEIGAYRLTCWHNRGKVGESVVDVVWAVELVRYTTEETFDDIETVTIELDGGNLTFGVLKGASAYEVAVAEGFVGTEAEWIASLKKPAEDAAADAEEAAARAINAAVEATESAENAQTEAGNARAAGDYAYEMANNAEAKAQLADAAADNANTAATEAYSKAQEADTAATTATNAAQSANSAAASANEAANSAVNAAVEATESAENAQTEAGNAHNAANYANEMAIAAERVNAQLNGNILTVTNRQGTSTSVNTKGEQGEQGNPGQAATISVGTTTTGAPGTSAQVTNSGTSSAAVLDFTIPQGAKGDKGEQGEQGNPGQAATISVGTTTTGAPGTSAQVTNSGTSSAAVLDFTIPQGAKGDKGDQGEPGEVTEAELTEKLAAKANTDGYYSRMIVGGAESLIGDVPQTATYTFRRTGGGAIGEPVARLTEVQGNTGVVNQLVDGQVGSTGWVTIRANVSINEGVATVSPTVANNTCSYCTPATPNLKWIEGHKYYIAGMVKGTTGNTYAFSAYYGGITGAPTKAGTGSWMVINGIVTATSAMAAYTEFRLALSQSIDANLTPFDMQWLMASDLTLEYGAGNEPGTVAEFEARIWRDYGKTLDEYVAYTPGKLINCKALALENVGQNQWDEGTENGAYNRNTGAKIAGTNTWRNTTPIRVLPNTNYYVNYVLYRLFYDASGNYIGAQTDGLRTFTTPANAAYMNIYQSGETAPSANICINISDAALNGTYRPYWKEVTNLNLTTLTGINPATGVREVVFPNGAGGGEGWRSVIKVVNGAVVAEVNTARVNLGDFTYTQYNTTSQKKRWGIALQDAQAPADNTTRANIKCSKYATTTASNIYSEVQGVAISNTHLLQIYDNALQTTAADVKAAMDGVFLEYQLATPIVYTDIQFADHTPFVLPKNYEVQNDGTERITHAEGEDSIAPVMSAIYGLNAVGFIQDAPKDYTSQATLDGLIAKISAITGTTITKTWDAANGKWVFS